MGYRPPLSAPLVFCSLLQLTGVFAGLSLRPQNISASEGRDVTLRCQISLENGTVTQVNWQVCNNNVYIAFQVATKGHVAKEFEGRVALEERFGITLLKVRRNDSGEYCCTVNVFPQGRLDGKIFLRVTAPARWDSYYIWAVVGGLILLAFGSAAVFYRTIKSRGARNATGPATPTSAPIPLAAGEEEEDDNGGVEYFNVLLYRPPPI